MEIVLHDSWGFYHLKIYYDLHFLIGNNRLLTTIEPNLIRMA